MTFSKILLGLFLGPFFGPFLMTQNWRPVPLFFSTIFPEFCLGPILTVPYSLCLTDHTGCIPGTNTIWVWKKFLVDAASILLVPLLFPYLILVFLWHCQGWPILAPLFPLLHHSNRVDGGPAPQFFSPLEMVTKLKKTISSCGVVLFPLEKGEHPSRSPIEFCYGKSLVQAVDIKFCMFWFLISHSFPSN